MKQRAIFHLVAGARPNFMKIAPLYHELSKERWAQPLIVHTGQHSDQEMSEVFFKNFDLPTPHVHLNVNQNSSVIQVAEIMTAYEKICQNQRPNLAIVVGDVNSTIACALAAVKSNVPVAHLESGLRSFDPSMPEELNRVLTDHIAEILWTPSLDADQNLLKEGISDTKIMRVGNIMIDALEMMRKRGAFQQTEALLRHPYAVLTLHRPSNVDDPRSLRKIQAVLEKLGKRIQIFFPIHPRTRNSLERHEIMSLFNKTQNLTICPPMDYFDFLRAVSNARLVLTDSGGVQEETTYLGIPCLTLRENTERPITIKEGTNRLVQVENLLEAVDQILNNSQNRKPPPDLWDGKTALRIKDHLKKILSNLLA